MIDSTEERAILLQDLFESAVSAVSGYESTYSALGQHKIERPVHLVALGKAADAMARGALAMLGEQLASGFVVTKHGHLSDEIQFDHRLECHESGHPVPDQASLDAGRKLTEFLASLPRHHLLLCLISGGTSALVERLDTGITLRTLRQETDQMLASGAPIGQINRHRRRLSTIKGGKLARWLRCPVLQLLISDVPGDKPADIGSGLLVPDGASGMGSDLAVWKGVHTEIIASSSIAQQAVAVAAEAKGFTVRQASGELYGEMPDVIERVSKRLLSANSLPGVYIWGGEPTIELPSNPGRGGRNQHLALAMSAVAAQKGNMSILVCGTDGTDGPTGDAGGLVSERTQKDAQENALDIDDYLAKADAGSCLSTLGGLITTGPTGTNVMDLAIAILD